ncbi:hypothetical protein FPZ42_02640 [Mucilaginibacter achroorhodeus]|uniref:Uncharacterized protein n=1 Tax=Mucilaginibacter achroorhodeus TaxID=2599294 RepID=A0A563U9R8_9SPHI|nr:hypothetical protein [Mucilaginibacter achroorhodeus]TWR28132.1 hypothetical protein FPZ42_02640 [Mucilaginibacter achroorhodeus]
MKLSNLRILLLLTLIFNLGNAAHAQDTTKKANAVLKPNPYKRPATTAQTPVASPVSTTPQPQKPVDKSLHGQYAYLLTKIYNYQQPLVGALVKNYNDTLKATRKQLKDAQETATAQAKTIDTLKRSSSNKDQSLAASQAKVNEVSLLGIPIEKGTYNLIMWGLVIVFGAIAAIVIARSGAHSREAKYRVKLYNELDEEYKNYKAKANEKEKKLARELQTERNKLDELTGKG